jgi:hypothetical protein
MLTAVDSGDNDGVWVNGDTIQLARVHQLKESLTNLWDSAINLIKEEDDRLGDSGKEPVGRVKSSCSQATDLFVGVVGQANQVALSHLRSAALNDRARHIGSKLIDNLRFADAVATTEQDGKSRVGDERGDSVEGFEIDCHWILRRGGLKIVFLIYIYNVTRWKPQRKA